MNLFRDTSIRTKLAVVLGMAVALIMGTGLVGLRQLQAVNNVAKEIRTVWLPRIEMLDEIKRSFGEHRLLATRRIQTTSFRDLADIAGHMEGTLKRLRASERSLEQMIDSSTERDLFTEFQQLRGDYETSFAAVLQRLEAGDIRAAIVDFNSVTLATFEDATRKLDLLSVFAKQQSDHASTNAERVYFQAVLVIILMIGIATMLSGAAITWTTRNVTSPLLRVTTAMRQLESGDLSVAVSGQPESKDEIGILIGVAAGYRDSLMRNVSLAAEAATAEMRAKAVELERSLSEEKGLNQLQRQFVSMASHEFRTPLAIIDCAAQGLKRRVDRMPPEEAIERIDKIRDAVKRMVRLMESTLMAARMEEGKISIEIETCDLGKTVREVCERQQDVVRTHNIHCRLVDPPRYIKADASALDQVLTNLLSNAVKYSPDAPEIDVVARGEGDEVVISVRDRGLGIDNDDLPRMFERFFRAKNSSGIAGTGIGLNLSLTLVKMHGGSIEVDSRKGEGSTFTVRLPVDGPRQAAQSHSQAA